MNNTKEVDEFDHDHYKGDNFDYFVGDDNFSKWNNRISSPIQLLFYRFTTSGVDINSFLSKKDYVVSIDDNNGIRNDEVVVLKTTI